MPKSQPRRYRTTREAEYHARVGTDAAATRPVCECWNCGYSLDPSAALQACPECGQDNIVGSSRNAPLALQRRRLAIEMLITLWPGPIMGLFAAMALTNNMMWYFAVLSFALNVGWWNMVPGLLLERRVPAQRRDRLSGLVWLSAAVGNIVLAIACFYIFWHSI